VKRVLVVKMSSLGDVIHALPALTDAARALPGIRFDWVVEEAFSEIPGWHTAVDEVIPIALRRWRRHPLRDFRGPEWQRCKAALRRHRYDLVIDAQGLLKSAFVARLVRAPVWGLDRASIRERLAACTYHHHVSVPREMHAVERVRMLFARVLGYPLPRARGEYGVRQNLAPGGEGQPPALLFCHGTARAEKLWPESHWAELARLAAGGGYTVWLPWGCERERERAQRIAGQVQAARVLPQLDLRGVAGMLLQVDGAVAVDTGLGHLAAALDVPAVSLYGPTSTRLVGTYGRNQRHIQSPLAAADAAARMAAIDAARVWQELRALLSVSD
jgi:heptosyltransferase-1